MTEQNDNDRERLDEIRRVIAEGVGFIQGEAFNDHIAELSFVSFLAEAIVAIEDDQSDIRPGKLNGLRGLKARIQDTVDRAKQLPAELFAVVVDPEDTEEEE